MRSKYATEYAQREKDMEHMEKSGETEKFKQSDDTKLLSNGQMLDKSFESSLESTSLENPLSDWSNTQLSDISLQD